MGCGVESLTFWGSKFIRVGVYRWHSTGNKFTRRSLVKRASGTQHGGGSENSNPQMHFPGIRGHLCFHLSDSTASIFTRVFYSIIKIRTSCTRMEIHPYLPCMDQGFCQRGRGDKSPSPQMTEGGYHQGFWQKIILGYDGCTDEARRKSAEGTWKSS
jgi:hypothetical protein